jgi:hypothetical protein
MIMKKLLESVIANLDDIGLNENSGQWKIRRHEAGHYHVFHDGKHVGHVYSTATRVNTDYVTKHARNVFGAKSYSGSSSRIDPSWEARDVDGKVHAQGMGSKASALAAFKNKFSEPKSN